MDKEILEKIESIESILSEINEMKKTEIDFLNKNSNNDISLLFKEMNKNTSDTNQIFKDFIKKAELLSQSPITPITDIETESFVLEIQNLIKEISKFENTIKDLKIKIDLDDVKVKELISITDKLKEDIKLNVSVDTTNLDKIQTELKDIKDINIDFIPNIKSLDDIKIKISELTKNVNIDIDTKIITDKITSIQNNLKEFEDVSINMDIKNVDSIKENLLSVIDVLNKLSLNLDTLSKFNQDIKLNISTNITEVTKQFDILKTELFSIEDITNKLSKNISIFENVDISINKEAILKQIEELKSEKINIDTTININSNIDEELKLIQDKLDTVDLNQKINIDTTININSNIDEELKLIQDKLDTVDLNQKINIDTTININSNIDEELKLIQDKLNLVELKSVIKIDDSVLKDIKIDPILLEARLNSSKLSADIDLIKNTLDKELQKEYLIDIKPQLSDLKETTTEQIKSDTITSENIINETSIINQQIETPKNQEFEKVNGDNFSVDFTETNNLLLKVIEKLELQNNKPLVETKDINVPKENPDNIKIKNSNVDIDTSQLENIMKKVHSELVKMNMYKNKETLFN